MPFAFQPPPTFADPVIVNALSGKSTFNPIWLQWFLSIAQFISGSQNGRLKSIVPATSSGTYQASPGTNNVMVFAQGGGGGGGNAQITASAQVSVGGGGGAGALALGLFSSGFNGVTVTVGSAGTGGVAGGSTLFGSLLTANGGLAGTSAAAGAAPQIAIGGVGGSSTGGQLDGVGDAGDYGIALSVAVAFGGKGAGSWFGQGGIGANARGFGAGGAGAVNLASVGSITAGFSGSAGFALILEFS